MSMKGPIMKHCRTRLLSACAGQLGKQSGYLHIREYIRRSPEALAVARRAGPTPRDKSKATLAAWTAVVALAVSMVFKLASKAAPKRRFSSFAAASSRIFWAACRAGVSESEGAEGAGSRGSRGSACGAIGNSPTSLVIGLNGGVKSFAFVSDGRRCQDEPASCIKLHRILRTLTIPRHRLVRRIPNPSRCAQRRETRLSRVCVFLIRVRRTHTRRCTRRALH